MSALTGLCNIFFIIITTAMLVKPIKRIVTYQSKSVADYVLALIYLFNCFPVALDLVIGIPQYKTWYSAFQEPLSDETTCIIYNIYNIIVMIVLSKYANKHYVTNFEIAKAEEEDEDNLVLNRWRMPAMDAVLIILPIIYAVSKCGISTFIGYATLAQRGIDSNVVSTINQLIMVGLFICITRFFTQKRGIFATIFLVLYLLLTIWINGKRYIIVTVMLMVFYLYQMRNAKKGNRVNLKITLPFVIIAFVAFSAYYILNVKIISTMDTLYSTLRIDFGRDDVTKFVIKRVLIDGDNILDYPGQTFLSAIFMLVPRKIWPTKPYPHYRYLSAAIFEKTVFDIPSGMTPSIFEMSICNFGWFGIVATIVVLLILCYYADKSSRLENKLLLLVILTNVLTQSLDAALSLLLVLVINVVFRKVRFTLGEPNRVRKYEQDS